MTKPLAFHRCTGPVQTIVPPLSSEDRVRAHLRMTNDPLDVEKMLRHWHVVENTRRKLGIKD